MTKRQLTITAAIVFFFGLPLAGILLPYWSAHSAMRKGGVAFAQGSMTRVFKSQDWDELEKIGTLELTKTLKRETFEDWLVRVGPLKSITGAKVTRSWVGTRNDQGWQFVSVEETAKFEECLALIKVTVARRSAALDEWRIEKLDLVLESRD